MDTSLKRRRRSIPFAGASGSCPFSRHKVQESVYEVVRLWNQPVDAFLSGGIGLLPPATLCAMGPERRCRTHSRMSFVKSTIGCERVRPMIAPCDS